MNEDSKLLQYLRLLRIQSVPHTASILLVGALIMGMRDIFLLSILFIIGVFSHFFGFVLNEYSDIEVDRKSKDLIKKPLVSGIIPKKNALIIVIISLIFAYLLTIIYFKSLYALIFLSIAGILAGGLYNIYGKKIPGSEFFVSVGLGMFCLFAASTVSLDFTNVIYFVTLLIFIESVFVFAVEGDIKDADHDYLIGAKTLTTLMGVKVKDGKLILPIFYKLVAYMIRVIYIILIILLGLEPEINLWGSDNYVLQFVVIFLLVMIFILTYRFLNMKRFDRSKIKKLYAGISAGALGLVFIMLIPLLGIEIVIILLILPATWYMICNKILYRKSLEPQV